MHEDVDVGQRAEIIQCCGSVEIYLDGTAEEKLFGESVLSNQYAEDFSMQEPFCDRSHGSRGTHDTALRLLGGACWLKENLAEDQPLCQVLVFQG